MNTVHRFTAKVGDHDIIVETGLLAQQAGGAVTVRCGDTMILATATASKEPREGVDFFPLTVDYEERLYAAGRIPGGFFKREGKPSEEAILLCRLTDRPLRPLFPKGFRNDVQIIVTALSADQENYLDILSIIGASAALTISDIPFQGPVGAVRVGYVDGRFVFNPTASEMA
ncbi:MAG: polyribonucleotide nucleotidyltransferase, partial [Halothiobacillaceae bacterium]